MNSERWEQIKSIFSTALDLVGDERNTFLDEACGDDSLLRREVEELLDMDGEGRSLLLEGRLVADEKVALPNPNSLLGTRIGPYRVKEFIGQGGMGAVYLAERDDDFTQKVALKLIRPGFDSAEAVARFRVERQILAHLQHPGIARLLDGGMTADGQPYLVMEYVAGTPITTFCDTNRYPIGQRLRLFRMVCAAVQFAHRNLIVHRDLKPSNILVTQSGEVKLLDFGIAKLLDPAASDVPVQRTQTEMRMLTPEYAAPEQVRGEPVTTATDVYALGVLLYELLTGHLPYRLRKRRQAEMERIICEEAPARPSTAIGEIEEIVQPDGTTETLTPERVSTARATQAARLRRALRGDLDNVVMMALRKEPARRYASADQMAMDLGRYLDGHPVIARKDTFSYRASKFVRRNRLGVGAAAGFVILLLVFSVVTASQVRRVAHERDKAEQVSTFLAGVFAAANPTTAQGDTLTAIELLERGTARIEAELADQPAVRADLLDVMSSAYLAQGAYHRAETLALQAVAVRLEDTSPALPHSLMRLAEALEAQSRFTEADSLFRGIVAYQRDHGDEPSLINALERRGEFLISSLSSPDTVTSVFQEALTLRRRHYGTSDSGLGRTLFLYASAYHVGGDYRAAEKLFREALDEQRRFPGDIAVTAQTLAQLGPILSFRREYAAADSVLREAAELHERLYGRAHPETASVLSYLALNLTSLERLDEAEALLQEVLATYQQFSGRESKDYVSALRALRQLLSHAERYDEAVAVAREVLELTEVVYGSDGRSYATNLAHFAQVLHNAGHPAEALPEYERALPMLKATFGAETPFYAIMLAETARAADDLLRSDEAETMYEKAYAIMEARLGTESYERSRVAFALGQRRRARGDHAEALALFEDAAAVRVGGSTRSAELAARSTFALGASLLALGRNDEARPYLQTAERELADLLGEEHEDVRAAARTLAAIP